MEHHKGRMQLRASTPADRIQTVTSSAGTDAVAYGMLIDTSAFPRCELSCKYEYPNTGPRNWCVNVELRSQ